MRPTSTTTMPPGVSRRGVFSSTFDTGVTAGWERSTHECPPSGAPHQEARRSCPVNSPAILRTWPQPAFSSSRCSSDSGGVPSRLSAAATGHEPWWRAGSISSRPRPAAAQRTPAGPIPFHCFRGQGSAHPRHDRLSAPFRPRGGRASGAVGATMCDRSHGSSDDEPM